MARTKIELTPELRKSLEEAAGEIVSALQGDFFTLDGTPKASVKMPDGTYRVKPLIAGWEYTLSYIYYGKRGTPIFGFEPEDTQPYVAVEFKLEELDTYLPLIGPAMAEKFMVGPVPENATNAYSRIIEKILGDRAVAAEKARLEEAAALTSNPIFGMF